MGIERVGLRRLYDSLGCGIKDLQEIQQSFPIMQDGEVSFYLGPKPPMGIVALEPSDPYYVPGEKHGCQAYTVDREPQKQIVKIASDLDSLPCVLVAERAGAVTVPTKNKERTKRNQ